MRDTLIRDTMRQVRNRQSLPRQILSRIGDAFRVVFGIGLALLGLVLLLATMFFHSDSASMDVVVVFIFVFLLLLAINAFMS
jgi:hypothetical protein